jgi:hypothetical protein
MPDADLAIGKIQFVESHVPSLKSGNYSIEVAQSLKATGDVRSITETDFPPVSIERHFSVQGPRFSLDPQEIHSVFPPAGSLGEHSNVLPHIIFRRSTLPWEREAEYGNQALPWLALLLFDADEEFLSENVQLKELGFNGPDEDPVVVSRTKELEEGRTMAIHFPIFIKENTPITPPCLVMEYGRHEDDQVSLIYIKPSLLKSVLPEKKEELNWLAHVRRVSNEEGQPEEQALIIGNRLPKAGSQSIVHLVSLEGCYTDQGFAYDFEQLSDDADLIGLVSLKSWRFSCLSERQSFTGMLQHLNHPLLFNLPAPDVREESNLLSAESNVKSSLEEAFKAYGHELSGSHDMTTDYSKWLIEGKKRRYLIGNSGAKNRIYSPSGRFLFETEEKITDFLSLTEFPAGLAAVFREKNYPLTSPSLKEVLGHWWLEDSTKKKKFFISQEERGTDDSGEPKYLLHVYELDLDSEGTLRLPKNENTQTEKYMAKGCVPLPHSMRQGNKSISWYHGPLVPYSVTFSDDSFPQIRAADNVMLYDASVGMFDVSYSAAWELGRLLILQNKQVSVNLYNWKRSNVHHMCQAGEHLAHLPLEPSPISLDVPVSVSNWFEQLALLKGIPFAYLVPDENLLPQESIRFFQLDNMWMECLLDGAFSVGRVLACDCDHDSNYDHRHKIIPHHHDTISGFLLRSELVSGWPGLQVDGYNVTDVDDNTPKLTLKRMDRLSMNVMICLFEGELQAVDIHQKPETIHFGFNKPDSRHNNNYYKVLRKNSGEEMDKVVEIENRLWGNELLRVLSISKLVTEINNNMEVTDTPFTSAQFALQMIEGVERVRFISGGMM